jgi:hypothetical protein
MPAAAGGDWRPDRPWFGVGAVVTRISVTGGEAHSVLPARAYPGMAGPGTVKINRLPRKGSWTLKFQGIDWRGQTSTTP